MNFDALHGPILAAVNLLGVLLCAAFLSYGCAQLRWRRGSFALVALAVILCASVWLIPQAISAFGFHSTRILLGLWFGDWLISAFAVVLLARVFAIVPRQLHDSAQLDGMGSIGVFRHIVFSFAKPTLATIGLFTIMATAVEFLRPLLGEVFRPDVLLRANIDPQTVGGIGMLIAGSIALALPVVSIAIAAARPSRVTSSLANA